MAMWNMEFVRDQFCEGFLLECVNCVHNQTCTAALLEIEAALQAPSAGRLAAGPLCAGTIRGSF